MPENQTSEHYNAAVAYTAIGKALTMGGDAMASSPHVGIRAAGTYLSAAGTVMSDGAGHAFASENGLTLSHILGATGSLIGGAAAIAYLPSATLLTSLLYYSSAGVALTIGATALSPVAIGAIFVGAGLAGGFLGGLIGGSFGGLLDGLFGPKWLNGPILSPDPRDPLVVDLDGNGIDLISTDLSNVHMDIDNDGYAERIAWVGPGLNWYRKLVQNGTKLVGAVEIS